MNITTPFDRVLLLSVGGVFSTAGLALLSHLLFNPLGEAVLKHSNSSHEPGYECALSFLSFGAGFICFGLSLTDQLRQRKLFSDLCGAAFLLAFLCMLGTFITAFLGLETDWLLVPLGVYLLRKAYHSAKTSPEYRYADSYPLETPSPSTSATGSIPSNPWRSLRVALVWAAIPLVMFSALGVFLGWKIDRWGENQFLPISDSLLPILFFGAVGLLGAVFVGCDTFFRERALQRRYPQWSGPLRQRFIAPYRDFAVAIGGTLQAKQNPWTSILPEEPERIDFLYRGHPATFTVNTVGTDETAYEETTIGFVLPISQDAFLRIIPRLEIINYDPLASGDTSREFDDHFQVEVSGSEGNPWIRSAEFREHVLQLHKWLVGVHYTSLGEVKIENSSLSIYFRTKCHSYEDLLYLHTVVTAICDAVLEAEQQGS